MPIGIILEFGLAVAVGLVKKDLGLFIIKVVFEVANALGRVFLVGHGKTVDRSFGCHIVLEYRIRRKFKTPPAVPEGFCQSERFG